MLGFGKARKGGTLLIDEPITTRQVVDKTGDFLKNPKKMLGFGKARKGGKLSLKGEGLLDDLKDLGHKIEQGFKSKVADPIQKVNIQKEAENLGKKTASMLIHEGIPLASSVIGSTIGSTVSGGPIGGLAGSQLGKMAGKELADYVGKETGYGLKLKKVLMHKRGKRGGALLPAGVEMRRGGALFPA